MITKTIDGGWQLRTVGEKDWIPAVVPGSVYTDLLREGKMEDPFWKTNEDKALALMDRDYEYRTEFDLADVPGEETSILEAEHVKLRFYGLDTICDITLNGQQLGHTQNMHRTWEYEVKGILREHNELSVIFRSPTKFIQAAYDANPNVYGAGDAMPGFVFLRKAHCMFGWDWGAHLPDAGIFRPVELIAYSGGRFDYVQVLQHHEGTEWDRKVTLKVKLHLCDLTEDRAILEYHLIAPNGQEVDLDGRENRRLQEDNTCCGGDGACDNDDGRCGCSCGRCEICDEIEVPNPQLWWPNGYGEQNLYTLRIELRDADETLLDVWEKRIGLRTLTMSTAPDEWGSEFATTVNGVKIFAMGADYIPEDHLLGRVNEATTRKLLERCIFAHMNSIRVWGGGYYPDDWFYDLCDELGLVVWQDCMFACAMYELTPEFEDNITAELTQNFCRMQSHACLGLLSGNNEMEQFGCGQGMFTPEQKRDYGIIFEYLIPRIAEKYLPQTFYWPSSPSSGGAFHDTFSPDHGDQHYWDVWHGNKPFSEYRKFFFRYASEFGFQSFPSFETVKTFTDDPRDWNIFSYVMERHQRNGQANGKIMNYMQQTYRYPSDFQTVLYASQLLQADAIRYGVEHFRRNRGRCMGAIYWQLNDCWPVASWSSIDYCGRLKALHYYAKRFFAPIMISCEEQGMMTSGKELNKMPKDFEKSMRLSVANETRSDVDVLVRWQKRNAGAKILSGHEERVHVPALSSVWLDKVLLDGLDIFHEYISYQAILRDEGKGREMVASEGTVNLSYPKYYEYEDPQLSAVVSGDEITVTAGAYAKSVEIRNENDDLVLSDNFFDMNAGTKTVRILEGSAEKLRLRSVYDIH